MGRELPEEESRRRERLSLESRQHFVSDRDLTDRELLLRDEDILSNSAQHPTVSRK